MFLIMVKKETLASAMDASFLFLSCSALKLWTNSKTFYSAVAEK